MSLLMKGGGWDPLAVLAHSDHFTLFDSDRDIAERSQLA
jgi:hypothetical protein